jgi:hypothetical protein
MLTSKNEVTGELTCRPAYMLDDAQLERVNRKSVTAPTSQILEHLPPDTSVALHVFCLPEQYSSSESIAKNVAEYSLYNLNSFKNDQFHIVRFMSSKLSSILNVSAVVENQGSVVTAEYSTVFRELVVIWFCTDSICTEAVESVRHMFQSARGLRKKTSEPTAGVDASLEFSVVPQAEAEIAFLDRYELMI